MQEQQLTRLLAALAQRSTGKQHAYSRHLLLLAGEYNWQQQWLNTACSSYQQDCLWVGDSVPFMPSLPYNKVRHVLGSEKSCVIFDTRQLQMDAMAAASGLVVGGGVFVLLLPARSAWSNVFASRFAQRFLAYVQSCSAAIMVEQDALQAEQSFPPALSQRRQAAVDISPCLTRDQANAVETMVTTRAAVTVLQADRGRGKSAALGIAAARLLLQGISRITVTAPSLQTAQVLFYHAGQLLPQAHIEQGCITLGTCRMEFAAPDQIIREAISAQVLLVDEAASIPLPLLQDFLSHFEQCVFATTVHGYEGTGRGFSLRFRQQLQQQVPDCQYVTLQTPIRWCEADPLEQWIFELLCLDAEPVADAVATAAVCNYTQLSQQALADNTQQLKDVFALLVLAHYRTRPSDLQRLLDDDSVSIYIAEHQGKVVAVCLLVEEGKLDAPLSDAIYRGERRIKGHLLAQSLTYHCGVEQAATRSFVRIMRIAVHPQCQQQGIGTALLRYVIQQQQGHVAVGTSFGLTPPLLSFWHRLGFSLVRIGFRREQSSGEHAAMMVQALNPAGEQIVNTARTHFARQLPYWLDDTLQDLKTVLPAQYLPHSTTAVATDDAWKKDVHDFVHYTRGYELHVAALHQWFDRQQQLQALDGLPDNEQAILLAKLGRQQSWSAVVAALGLDGQKTARALFHRAVQTLWQQSVPSLQNIDKK